CTRTPLDYGNWGDYFDYW
nr:immunoglobulin heavy chain junction region [Mus musculus]MBK4189336.1 immunoglobulin heavy chain junction region [Mus musculus]